jgi:CheY-like chemotaxis protein
MNKLNTVCVIDDDKIYSFAIKHIINRSGITENIILFHNGRVAMDFFHQQVQEQHSLPDVILLDLNMPVLDGWQFLEEFETIKTSLKKTIPIYIVSSSIDEEEHSRAKAIESVNDFITKPITVSILQKIHNQIC